MSRIGVLRFRLDEAQAELERLRASSFVTAVPSEEYERLQSENKLVREESDRHYQLWVNSQADLEKSDGVVWTLAVENTHLKAEVTDLKSMADRFKAEVESLMTNPTSRLLRAEREENARLKAEVERLTKGHSTDFVRAEMYRHLLDENAKLKEEVMRMRNDDYKEGDILQKCCEHQKNRIERLKAEVERLTSDLQMEKENEDRLVREWQKANNEVYGLQRQVAALIDDQTRLKAEVADLKSDADRLKADNETKA